MYNNDEAFEGCIAGVIVVLLLLAVAVFIWAKTSTYDTKFTAVNQTWERVYHIQNYQPRYRDTETSYMPFDAYNISRYERYHSDSYNCGKKNNSYCGDSWTEYRARYYIDRWEYFRDIWTRGSINDERVWPAFTDSPLTFYGAERLAGQEEFLWDNFSGEANHNIRDFRYRASSDDDWKRFPPETAWGIKVNRLDEPQWDTIQKVNMQ